jgi:hypothetical protein
MVRGQTS